MPASGCSDRNHGAPPYRRTYLSTLYAPPIAMAFFPREIIDFPVLRKQNIGIFILAKNGSAAPLLFLITGYVARPFFVVSVDAEQRHGQLGKFFLEFDIELVQMIIDSGVAENNQNVLRARVIFPAEVKNSLKLTVGVSC
jgi:hypothetical protein